MEFIRETITVFGLWLGLVSPSDVLPTGELIQSRYVPTPAPVVQKMLDMAQVRLGDVVMDLGCGDGRLPIAAAVRGAEGVCIELDGRLVERARRNAAAEGARVRFVQGDLFRENLSGADVVTLFLHSDLMPRLGEKLRRELRPGARIVSHWYPVDGWQPDRVERINAKGRERPLYLYVVK